MLSRFMKSCICALLVLLATTRASVLTQQVEADPSIRVVHIEYVLNVGQTLAAINASINAAASCPQLGKNYAATW